MNEYNNILFSKEKDFYLVKINRPKQLNALNQETISELRKSLRALSICSDLL